MGEANSGKISLKLLVDRNENRVIFGEAGKEFVDFLFSFLSLPVGTVVELLSKDKMVGSLGKIYESIEDMHANYLEPDVDKEHALNPKVSSSSLANTSSLLGYKTRDESGPNYSIVFYRCSNQYGCGHWHISADPQALCPKCKSYMNTKLTYVRDPEKEAAKVEKGPGYVKGWVNYMVMDNLQVKPLLSSISSINLLSTFKVKNLSSLETLEVCIGKKEAMEMLKASFVTDKVLTSLFLVNQKASNEEDQFDWPKNFSI